MKNKYILFVVRIYYLKWRSIFLQSYKHYQSTFRQCNNVITMLKAIYMFSKNKLKIIYKNST